MRKIAFVIITSALPFFAFSQIKNSEIFRGDSLLISRIYEKDFIEFICEPASKVLKDKDLSKYTKIELRFTNRLSWVDGFSLYFNDVFYVTVRVKKPIKRIPEKEKSWFIKQLLLQKVALMFIPDHLILGEGQ
jgi:hypothetical protein